MDCLKEFDLKNPKLKVIRSEKKYLNENNKNHYEPLNLSKLVNSLVLRDAKFLNLFDEKWFQKTAKVKNYSNLIIFLRLNFLFQLSRLFIFLRRKIDVLQSVIL